MTAGTVMTAFDAVYIKDHKLNGARNYKQAHVEGHNYFCLPSVSMIKSFDIILHG